MGWASGTYVARDIIEGLQNEVYDYDVRIQIYIEVIKALESNDWDTQDEAMGLDEAFDEAMKKLHPKWWKE